MRIYELQTAMIYILSMYLFFVAVISRDAMHGGHAPDTRLCSSYCIHMDMQF